MEPARFDEFTKAMATPTSRRQALKRMVAGTFGSLLALSGIGRAFASKCPPGKTDCGGKCVDTKTDPNNCGVCGTKCKSGLCVNGLCCPVGAVKCGNSCCSFTCCGGNTCTNLQNDKNNCGACGNVCGANQACQKGKCVTLCTPNGQGPCTNCCPGLLCDLSTFTCVTCIPEGDFGCVQQSDCCPGTYCDVSASTCYHCIPGGDPCVDNDHCCSGVCNTTTGECE